MSTPTSCVTSPTSKPRRSKKRPKIIKVSKVPSPTPTSWRPARPNCPCTQQPRSRCPSRVTRSDETSRAGVARVGSSSSAMADPKAENALREALATLEDLESRWSAAREYLKIDASRERHVVLSELVADPNLWDDQDRARAATTELGRLSNDLEQFDELRGSLDDSMVLAEFSRESLAAGDADGSSPNEYPSIVTS